MVINLPEGAEKAWFQDDDGSMREGFIMTDGSAYMIDKYSKTVKVNLQGPSKKVKFDRTNTQRENETTTYDPYEPEVENERYLNEQWHNQHSTQSNSDNKKGINTSLLVIGIVFTIGGILLALYGYNNYQYYQSAAGQFELALGKYGFGNNQNYQYSIYMMIGGVISFIIGLACIIDSS